MRLIDADKLKEMFEKRINENNKTIFTHIIQVLDAMPTECDANNITCHNTKQGGAK